MRSLAVAQVGARGLDDLREADHRDEVARVDRAAVDLLEEVDLVLEAAELGVVVLDVPARELIQPLYLDVVDHRGEDLLPRTVAKTDRDPDDLAALVLVALVAEPDRRGLAPALQLVDEDRRVKVQDVDAAPHASERIAPAPGRMSDTRQLFRWVSDERQAWQEVHSTPGCSSASSLARWDCC